MLLSLALLHIRYVFLFLSHGRCTENGSGRDSCTKRCGIPQEMIIDSLTFAMARPFVDNDKRSFVIGKVEPEQHHTACTTKHAVLLFLMLNAITGITFFFVGQHKCGFGGDVYE